MTEGKSPKRKLTEEAKEGKLGMTEQEASDKRKSKIKSLQTDAELDPFLAGLLSCMPCALALA